MVLSWKQSLLFFRAFYRLFGQEWEGEGDHRLAHGKRWLARGCAEHLPLTAEGGPGCHRAAGVGLGGALRGMKLERCESTGSLAARMGRGLASLPPRTSSARCSKLGRCVGLILGCGFGCGVGYKAGAWGGALSHYLGGASKAVPMAKQSLPPGEKHHRTV